MAPAAEVRPATAAAAAAAAATAATAAAWAASLEGRGEALVVS